ncbi:hypothetical protein [Rubripirellula reticaptiva]|uniref:Cellulose-binding protein n=1 Tax=Rubripirellula reticaptiva TaxID=2528013 RepID=A0A5C6FDN9_9BACT|nr:hypothetical protein [Rubripirellula reticaptiva]TWU57739.1 hypothetical protein Poly59_06480 [Rubripirellula reticaptiva]
MLCLRGCLAGLFLLVASWALAADRDALLKQPAAGINFTSPVDYSSELPLVDVFRTSRKWISQTEGAAWGKGPELELDPHGYVTKLQPGSWVETPVCNIEGGHYPSGVYTLIYDGEGEIEIGGAGKVTKRNSAGNYSVMVDASRGPIWVRVRRIDPENHVRNIRLIMPGFLDTYQDNPWRPGFMKLWSSMKAFRSMDWQHTNNSTIKNADDFPSMEDANWTERGLPLEVICDFANRTRQTPWVCVPHLATDEAVRHMAMVINDSLDKDACVIVEYSNEVWNGQFMQCQYVQQRGVELKLGDKPWEAGWSYTGKRSIEVFKIFEDVFGGTDRLIRTLPSQSANAYVAGKIVEAAMKDGSADALAIAPYMGMNVQPEKVAEILTLGVEGIFKKANDEILPETIRHIQDNLLVAKKNGLALVAYEAGQHFVGIGPAMNNDALTKLLHDVNADQQMGVLYRKYLEAWSENGGSLMCLFSSTGSWSKYGSWGLTQYADDDPSASPKLKAVSEWATSTK